MRLLVPAVFAVTTTWVGLVAVASMTVGLLTITRRTRVSRLISTDFPTNTCSVCVSGEGAACCSKPSPVPVRRALTVRIAIPGALRGGSRLELFSGLVGRAFREFLFTAFLSLNDFDRVNLSGFGPRFYGPAPPTPRRRRRRSRRLHQHVSHQLL